MSACQCMQSAILSWQICPSVPLSVCHTLVLSRNGYTNYTYRQTLSTVWYGHNSILRPTSVTEFQRELPQRRRQTHECGKTLRFSTEIPIYLRNGKRDVIRRFIYMRNLKCTVLKHWEAGFVESCSLASINPHVESPLMNRVLRCTG